MLPLSGSKKSKMEAEKLLRCVSKYTKLHGVISKKMIFINTAVRTLNLALVTNQALVTKKLQRRLTYATETKDKIILYQYSVRKHLRETQTCLQTERYFHFGRWVMVVFKINAFPKPVSLQRGCQISNVIFLTLSLNVYSKESK